MSIDLVYSDKVSSSLFYSCHVAELTGSGNVSELCSMFIKVSFSCTGLSEFSRRVIESPSFVTSVMVFSAVHNSRKRYQWGDVANKEKQEKNKAQPRVVQL